MKGLYIILLLLVFSSIDLPGQAITGAVYDKVSLLPLAHVSVTIYERPTDTLANGTLNLRPMAEARQVDELRTNEAGHFRLNTDILQATYYYARFHIAGYEEMLYTLLRLDPGNDASIEMGMYKSLPTRAESAELLKIEDNRLRVNNDAKNEEWSRTDMLQHPPVPSHAGRQQRVACTYTVPPAFYVKNLSNGYNSYSCPASGTFTGNMPQDEYIGGCVAGEMGSSFPQEAQKTQAVCARTYALKRQNAGSGANCGQAYSFTVCSSCTTAAAATTNQVITYNGALIEALYAARCNGSYTETASPSGCNAFSAFPYLVCTICSGHTDCQTAGEPCTSCTNACTNTASKVYGHGVGMCQRGSQGFALAGQTYTWIVNHYYSGICLANTNAPAPSNDNCSGATQLTSNTSCSNILSTVNDATADNLAAPGCDLYTPAANILGAGVFFKFTAVSNRHTIQVTPTGNLDALLVLYSGSCNNLQEVGCIDQTGGAGVTTTLTVNNLTINQQYWIRVYDYGSANTTNGGFHICITHQPCTIPAAATSITSSDNTYCTGQNAITLTANGTLSSGAQWKWYSNSCGGTAVNTGSSIQVSPDSNTIFYLRAESSCGNSACTSKQITVSQPAPAPVISASGSTTLCSNQTVNIAISNPCSGCTYVWSTGSNANTITADTTGGFYVTQNSACGGFQSSNTIQVVKSQPIALATANPPSIHAGDTATLQGAGGISCEWAVSGGGSLPTTACTTSVSPAQTTNYDLIVADTNGCTTIAQTSVSVIPVGCSYAVSPSGITTDSSGTSATISVTTTGSSCTWQATPSGCGFLSLQNAGGTNSGTFTVMIPATNDTVTQICTINVNGQLITVTQTGKIPKGNSPACSIDTSITLNGNCKLTAKNIAGATYRWFKDGVEIAGAGSRVYNATENAVYNVIITVGNCAAIGSDWYLNCITALPESNALQGLAIFPNPNNGKFRLIAELPDKEPLIIAVYNAPGQKVYEATVRETQVLHHEIDLSNIATGIYTVQVKCGIHIVSKKLLIQQ